MSEDGKTHFGFRDVEASEKAGLVGEVFDSVASRYDVMNDLMSFGVHRLWKRFTVAQSGLKRGDKALDVAAGSADLSRHFANQVGPHGEVTVTDINAAMLQQGKNNLMDAGIAGNVKFAIADAEELDFPENHFECVSISFGLRNVTDKDKALRSMFRVVKPGGRVLVLEFSKPLFEPLEKIYDAYSFNVIPKIGKMVLNDESSYQYLVESIRKHPDQQTLKQMMLDAGFAQVRVHNLSAGVVALHIGYKS